MIDNDAWVTQAWSDHHGFLLDVAYRLLGSYTEAEDLVQEAFTKLLRTDIDPIEDVRAWLVVVVSRLCLDQLRSARARREAYVGPWFPEPLIHSDEMSDPADIVTMDESVRMALLIVLERMSPAERVVFVLHDVFDFPFERVAPMVKRSPAACRQLASRARRRINEEAASQRFAIDPQEQRRVVDAFIAACAGGDLKALLPLLDPSVVGWADVGGTLAVVSQPNVGRALTNRGVGVACGVGRARKPIAFRPGAEGLSRHSPEHIVKGLVHSRQRGAERRLLPNRR